MNQLTKLFSYNGNEVTFRSAEGTAYVNATQMAKSFDKKPAEYLRLPSTKELIEACMGFSHTSESQFVITKMGSAENGGGTWLHETIALDFAQWLSVEFKLWCNDRIKELLTVGITAMPKTIEDMLSNPDMIIQMATQLKQLRHTNLQQKAQLEVAHNYFQIAKPKVDYHDEVLTSNSQITTNAIAMELGLSAIKLNRFLKEKKVIYKQGDKWLLTSSLRGKGYEDTYTYRYFNTKGEPMTKTEMRWTEKGREFIHNLFKN